MRVNIAIWVGGVYIDTAYVELDVSVQVCGVTKRIMDELRSLVKSLENLGDDKIKLERVYTLCP